VGDRVTLLRQVLNPSERKLVDTSKVSPGEMIAGISALALFIFLFLPWYGVDSVGGFGVGDLGGSLSAWEAFDFIDILLFLAAVVVVGLVLARAADALPQLPQPPALMIAAAGAIALVLILFRLLVAPDFGTDAVDVDLGRKLGIFLALLSAAGITYGGWRAMNEPVAAGPGNRGDHGVPPASRTSSTPPSTPAGGATSTPASQSSTDPTSPAGGTTPSAGSSTPPPAPPSGGQTPQP
jgi:hypothetical protein